MNDLSQWRMLATSGYFMRSRSPRTHEADHSVHASRSLNTREADHLLHAMPISQE